MDDIEATVDGLRARGVAFEEYDYPNLKTVNGIATVGLDQVAWFKDPDENIRSVGEEG